MLRAGADDRFEAEVRAALRLERAAVRVGVAAPQLRGRIAGRERTRRRAHLRLAALVPATMAALGGLALLGRLAILPAAGPPPGAVQPALVAALDSGGDLVLRWAWPNGRDQAGVTYRGALGPARDAAGDPAIATLPAGTVATAGPDGRLAALLPSGDILVAREPGDRVFVARVATGPVERTWLGWAEDGRLVAIGRPEVAADARLRVHLVNPDTGGAVDGALPYGTTPLAAGALLTWVDRDAILAARTDPATFAVTIGSVNVTTGQPAFSPGLPVRVRLMTGLEAGLAADGSGPARWAADDGPGSTGVGLERAGDPTLPAATWYVAAPGERILDVARAADQLRLLVLVARTDGSAARLVVADAPGAWRDAVTLWGASTAPAGTATTGGSTSPGDDGAPSGGAAPSDDGAAETAALARILGVAPDGRSVAVAAGDQVIVADLGSGDVLRLPPGAVFVGWPEVGVAAMDAIPTLAACQPPSPATAGTIAMAATGAARPAARGTLPLVGTRADADPWRQDDMAAANVIVVPSGGTLVLALPGGTCADAFRAEAVALDGEPVASPVRLVARTAGSATTAGLLDVPAPRSPGDWVVRVRLWLAGADREATLLYHVRTAGP